MFVPRERPDGAIPLRPIHRQVELVADEHQLGESGGACVGRDGDTSRRCEVDGLPDLVFNDQLLVAGEGSTMHVEDALHLVADSDGASSVGFYEAVIVGMDDGVLVRAFPK